MLLVQAQGTPPPTPLTLIAREGRRAVPTVVVSGQELIGLDDVASLFQVTVAEDAPTGGVTVTYRGRTIVLSAQQSIASVNGRVVTLPAPVTRSGRRLLVPVEFLSRALAPIYDRRIDLRRPSRLLIVGDVTVPRVVARIDAAGPPSRATIEVTPATQVTVSTDKHNKKGGSLSRPFILPGRLDAPSKRAVRHRAIRKTRGRISIQAC